MSTPSRQANGQPVALPPVVLYLPSMSGGPENTTTRIADIIADELTRGPGAFTTRDLERGPGALVDGRRVLDADATPVMDFYTVAYKERLPSVPTDADNTGPVSLIKLLLRQVWYFARALALFVGAGRRAKGAMAKLQLVYGFGVVFTLVLSIALTIVSVLVALGIVDAADAGSTWADATAIGLTGVTTWALTKSAPTIQRAGVMVQQMLDYAQDTRQTVTVTNSVGEALDSILEEDADRAVYLMGYSVGALVGIDYLFPRGSQLQYPHTRDASSIRGLITVGNPLDFVRLYLPDYAQDRISRVTNMLWVNVFIPADILGSNMLDGDDTAVPNADAVVTIGNMAPTECVRYTNETLTWKGLLRRRGFFSHGGYWSLPKHGNCLGIVVRTVAFELRI